MGHEAIWCKPRTSIPDDTHRKYPYLLRKLKIERPNQVWCADITYVPMAHGHAYLCAVMDWHSRKVLGWELSNTMDTELCLRALNQAVASTGRTPEIFNTDQGCQFTSEEWIGRLTELGVKISMDGRGRWMDNVFIEQLWRSVKYPIAIVYPASILIVLALTVPGMERLSWQLCLLLTNTVLWIALLVWWIFAIRNYLKIPHGWIVAPILAFITVLVMAVFVAYVLPLIAI